MLNRVFTLLKQNFWNKKKTKNVEISREEENAMATKATALLRPILTSEDFDKSPLVCEIKRIKKQLVMRDNNGKIEPVSQNKIRELRNIVLSDGSSVKIEVTGVSRAEVGRIAGDLKGNSPTKVYARKIEPTRLSRPQANRFEILIQGGNSDFGKEKS